MAAGGVSDYQVNILNMAKYVDSFQDRDDVSDKLKGGLKIDTLLVTGSKQSSLKACEAMFSNCNKVYMNITCNILVNLNLKNTMPLQLHHIGFFVLDKDVDYQI